MKIHVITNNYEEYIENAKGAFSEIIDSLSSISIDLSYEFNDTLHDRSIEMNNGWKIILGRGLDIWQKQLVGMILPNTIRKNVCARSLKLR